MATHAGPPIFDEEYDKWEAYQVRLEAFFEAHEIVDPKKRRALVANALSTKTVDLLEGRCAPENIQDLTYRKQQLKNWSSTFRRKAPRQGSRIGFS
ncbi:hypothetical protein HPB50_006009 [Hyalomma asiaticum]|uniref:Uncharacterized protein n=1 Tax=Hyalomma asiaticum TaxID=266040 RepID=A0ACB7SBF0_HYAAI|nr:hypothetical protein HPB50_006009 [Hyalomma asiaticum]